MKLIVTHENADFDAVASLLAATRLYSEAYAVLPRHVNRNVRDFLTLYWDEFPLIRWEDVPAGGISKLIMVDTQTPPALKGLDGRTQFQIIDHHAPHPERPVGAVAEFLETGATVTFLVEQLFSQGIAITPIEASFFLLGIYEDTGSLSYTSTTSRDIRAAAWLLEQNARLDVVRDFLHYPMTPNQLDLYKQLTDRLETVEVGGRQIMIGLASSPKYVAEISTLAHKIRRLYEPDALFLLVDLDDHIQVVARSSTDTIDVGAIAKAFEGGGHPRAAAAVIRNLTLEQSRDRLLETLRQQIKPVVTVRQIMSYGVKSLAPTDTIRYAAEMMRRYGHEGYPIIEDERVLGILTRREIDKALHHKLGGATVTQYMRKGDFHITPDQSLEQLQLFMTTHNIGQVPVVEAGKVIGIVTRTDIINLWSKATPPYSETTNLAQALAETVPSPLLSLLREAGELASTWGDMLYIVGGFVRDLLLGTHNLDIDLVVEGDAIILARQLLKKHGGRVRSHRRFGTANWILANDNFGVDRLDFVSARQEFYEHPSALPEVERSSIKQDLHRRDFTINTLAIRLDPAHFGELLDFYGGRNDLARGLIRVLHSLSFVEDPTRILRAVRLEQRLNFQLETHTAEHLQDALDLLHRVSGERIYHELERSFQEAAPEKAMRRLDDLGVLEAIQPGLVFNDRLAARYRELRQGLQDTPWSQVEPGVVHYLGLLTFDLPPAAVKRLADRLRLRSNVATILDQVQTIKSYEATLSQPQKPSELYRLLSPCRDEALLVAWLGLSDQTARAQIAQFQRELRGVQPIIDGTVLRQTFNVRPGPIYRYILDRLREARLDGKVITLDEEKALVQNLLQSQMALDGEDLTCS
ncbi:MAG: CBS domain-containing protein [Anaerolineae bacterium]